MTDEEMVAQAIWGVVAYLLVQLLNFLISRIEASIEVAAPQEDPYLKEAMKEVEELLT